MATRGFRQVVGACRSTSTGEDCLHLYARMGIAGGLPDTDRGGR